MNKTWMGGIGIALMSLGAPSAWAQFLPGPLATDWGAILSPQAESGQRYRFAVIGAHQLHIRNCVDRRRADRFRRHVVMMLGVRISRVVRVCCGDCRTDRSGNR